MPNRKLQRKAGGFTCQIEVYRTLYEKPIKLDLSRDPLVSPFEINAMLTFVLWCMVLIFCWPLALAALVLYPFLWLLLLPFRIAGLAVGGILVLVWSIFLLPVRVLRRI